MSSLVEESKTFDGRLVSRLWHVSGDEGLFETFAEDGVTVATSETVFNVIDPTTPPGELIESTTPASDLATRMRQAFVEAAAGADSIEDLKLAMLAAIDSIGNG